VATVTRRCQNAPQCKIRFRISSQSRRVYCETCRPPRSKAGAVSSVPGSSGPSEPGPVEARALLDLAAFDRQDTVPGLIVLSVARDIDSGRVKPEQKAQAGQRMLALLAVALAGTTPARSADRLDEVTARREAKAAAAS